MKAKFFTSGALAAAAILASSALSPAQAAGFRGNLSFDQVSPGRNLVNSISDPVVDFNNNSGIFEVDNATGDFSQFLGSGVILNDINLSTFTSGFELFSIAGGPTFSVRNFKNAEFGTARNDFEAEVRGFFTGADGRKSEATSFLFSFNASGRLNDEVDFNLVSVPTPAMLPGLIGMGVAALRRRKSEELKTTEA